MIFHFLKYVQPIWYFNLSSVAGKQLWWVNYNRLSKRDQQLIAFDTGYQSHQASLRDAAYQAFQKGIISFDPDDYLELRPDDVISLYDEYRFIRKYFHTVWAFYIFILRLVTLHNPIREVVAFFRTARVRRVKLFDKVREYPEVSAFESSLLESSPFISVVIPTLNRYAYLDRVLSDLENQAYKNFEVIVVDQTVPFNDSIYLNRRLDLKVIRQSEKALWKARNEAILQASGRFIALYDDDSIIEPDWLEKHLRCIDYFSADISAGVSISRIGAKVPDHYSFFRWSDQFDTGNALLRREVFERIGLFDRQFERQRMGDGEFGLRAYLSGFRSISNPLAKRVHLKVESGGLRQMGSWDGYRPVSFFSVRPIPSVLYLTRKYFGCRQSVLNLLIKIPASVLPLQFKNRPFLLLITSIASVVISPILLVQVMMSWRRSTQMLNRGALIDKINN